jgi:cell wall assembly regulator SMI1
VTQKDSQNRTDNPSKGSVEQAERLGRFQAELFEKIAEVNLHWFERAQSEATLAGQFAAMMMSARSFPEAATVYQEWASRRLKLALEDASYAISTGQTLMDMGARLLQGKHKGKG